MNDFHIFVNIKNIVITGLFCAAMLPGCGENDRNNEFSNEDIAEISPQEIERLRSKKSFDELFRLVKTITLNESDDAPIGTVNEIQSDAAGNLYIRDNVGNQILSFNAEGQFITNIGRQGSGPEEFSIAQAMYYRNQSIYIADSKRLLIHQFTSDNRHIKSFKMASFNCYGFFVSRDEKKFFTYDPFVMGAPRQSQITIQDSKGRALEKFCEPSMLAKKKLPLPNFGFAAEERNNHIFQVNAHEYKIKVYNENGELLNVIANEQEISECKSLPPDFPVRRDFSDTYQKKFRDSFNWIDKIYVLDSRFLLVTYLISIRPNPIIYQLDLLSVSGDFINCNLRLPAKIKGVSGKYLYTLGKREMTTDGVLTPVVVNVWELDPN